MRYHKIQEILFPMLTKYYLLALMGAVETPTVSAITYTLRQSVVFFLLFF